MSTQGEGSGSSWLVVVDKRGGGGVKTGKNLVDVISERNLTRKLFLNCTQSAIFVFHWKARTKMSNMLDLKNGCWEQKSMVKHSDINLSYR